MVQVYRDKGAGLYRLYDTLMLVSMESCIVTGKRERGYWSKKSPKSFHYTDCTATRGCITR